MATYSSFKKLSEDNFLDNTVTSEALQHAARPKPQALWIFNERGFCCNSCANAGSCVEQASGRCCQWTVPDGVTRVTFEIWSGGGGGAGHTCRNCCSHSVGGAGGNYAIKTIETAPGNQYTICAGGSWPCAKSHTCTAGMGCRSFVTGCNLDNFCVNGGCGGWMCNGTAWGPQVLNGGCANCGICGFFGSDFGMMGTVGFKQMYGQCQCKSGNESFTGAAPLIGMTQKNAATNSWCSCGCYVNWPAGGGISGNSSYCGNARKCCAGGSGQGGSGIVKVTFA